MSEISFPVFLDSNTPIFSYKEIFFCDSSWTVNGEMGGGVSQPLFCEPLMFSCNARSEP